MKTSIYINNDVMQIVRVKGRRYKYDSIVLNEGTVLNGVILDPEEMTKKLKEHRKKLGKVTVVVDSSNIMTKKMQIPKLSKKKSLSVIKSEFDLGEGHEYIYDMNLLQKGKKENTILGCAVPKEFMGKYLTVFKEARIKVLRIDVAINGVVKYVGKLPVFKGKTFLMNIISDNTLLSLLFENGTYILSNRNRMFNEVGSEAYVSELYSKYSSMTQFAKMQKVETEILDSYYIGIDTRTMRTFKKYVRENDSVLTVESYKDMERDMDYIYAIMGNLVNKEDIDLKVKQKTVSSSKKKGKGGTFLKFLLLVILCVPFVLYSQQLAAQNAVVESEIAALETYVTAKEEANLEAGDMSTESMQLANDLNEYNSVIDKVENSKYVSTEMLEEIYSGDVTIVSLNYTENNASLMITGYGDSQEAVVEYSEGLRLGAYSDAQYYSGYSLNEEDYEFTITSIWNIVESEEEIDDENEQ